MNGLGNVCMNETLHLAKVGEAMRDARLRGDRRGADVEIVCDEHRDLVHFHLAAAHSDLIRRTIDSRPLPFKIVMSGCKPQALTQVIDWMYSGKLQFPLQNVGDYLAITAVLCIEQLHLQLEVILTRLTAVPERRIPCINIATDPRYKISSVALAELLAFFGRNHEGLSGKDVDAFNLSAILGLVSCSSIQFIDKIDMINIAILWLNGTNRATHLGAVLDAIRIARVKPTALHLFTSALKHQFEACDVKSRQTLHAFSKDGYNVELSCDSQHLKHLAHQRSLELRTARGSGCESDGREHAHHREHGTSNKYISNANEPSSRHSSGSHGHLPHLSTVGHQRGFAADARGQNMNRYSSHCDESVAEIKGLPNAFGLSSNSSRRSYCDESIAEIRELPNAFCTSATVSISDEPVSPGGRTLNRYEASSDSVAEIGQLPSCFAQKVELGNFESDKTINRYAASQDSVAEIEELPICFIPEVDVQAELNTRTLHRHDPCEESIAEISALPSFFALQEEAPRTAEAPSRGENTRPDAVIGKKLMSREELDELRSIPAIGASPSESAVRTTSSTQANTASSSSSRGKPMSPREAFGVRHC